jgi:L-fucose isomerase-like protein
MQFAQVKSTELMYVHKKGLQKELEKLCCFGSLKPEKVVARLGKNLVFPCNFSFNRPLNHLSMHTGHLQAEAKQIFDIKASKIEIIEEEGHEGKNANLCIERLIHSSHLQHHIYAQFNVASKAVVSVQRIFSMRRS